MKKSTIWLLAPILCAFFALTASAEERATKEECVKMVKAAAETLLADGPEVAMAKINDPNGPFVWKDSYVFCMTIEEGIMVAHPFKPRLRGKKIKGIKDVNGVMFVMEYITKAKLDGEGWTDYMWPKPGEKTPSSKTTYTYKPPGHDYILGAGIYN